MQYTLWSGNVGGASVPAPALHVCLHKKGSRKGGELIQGARKWTNATQMRASRTRTLRGMVSRQVCLLDPSFPCGTALAGEGNELWDT